MILTTGSNRKVKSPPYTNDELQVIKNGAGVVHLTEITRRVNEISKVVRSEASVKSVGQARGFKFKIIGLCYDLPDTNRYSPAEHEIIKVCAGAVSMELLAAELLAKLGIKRSVNALKCYCNKIGVSYRMDDKPPPYSDAEKTLIRKNAGVIPLKDITLKVNALGVYPRTQEAIRSFGVRQGLKFMVKNYDY